MESIQIAPQFCGPEGWGHGGYLCGLLGKTLGNQAEVTLRKPIPLETELEVERVTKDQLILKNQAELIAEAVTGELDMEVPRVPSLSEVRDAVSSFIGFQEEYSYPTCFVCGRDRGVGDGLRIFPGLVGENELVAAPWIPDASFGNEDAIVRPEFIWAALDCPGGISAMGHELRYLLLGRFAVRIDAPFRCGETYLALGWPTHRDRRKFFVGSALASTSGEILATAQAIWIEVPSRAPQKA